MRDMKTAYMTSVALWSAIEEHDDLPTEDTMRDRISTAYDYAVDVCKLDPYNDASEILLFLEDCAVSCVTERCYEELLRCKYRI